MKNLLFIILIAFTTLTIKAQDTIFVNKDGKIETILCKITKITSMRVFYTENGIGTSILLKDLDNYKVSAESSQKMAINSGFMEAPKPIAKIDVSTTKQATKGKEWLVLSGVALMASGVCNLMANNRKVDTTTSLSDFAKNTKTLGNVSSSCMLISGLFLSIGITIHFN